MHWGLTRFERKRIERIALDHPFFDVHVPLLTRKEIRAFLAQGARKTGPQVIAEVKKELGLDDAPVIQQKRTLMDALRDASFVPAFRRIVVFSACCLLLALFMTLTAPGKAFAEEVYSVIINFVNGMFRASSSAPVNSTHNWDFSILPKDIDSPKALASALEYPITITKDKLVSFSYTPYDTDYLLIKSTYENEQGIEYVLQEEIFGNDVVWGYGADLSDSLIETQSNIGIPLFGGSLDDGTIFLSGFTEQSVLQLLSKQLTMAELIHISKRLCVVS